MRVKPKTPSRSMQKVTTTTTKTNTITCTRVIHVKLCFLFLIDERDY